MNKGILNKYTNLIHVIQNNQHHIHNQEEFYKNLCIDHNMFHLHKKNIYNYNPNKELEFLHINPEDTHKEVGF
jgi:hypothetical protein